MAGGVSTSQSANPTMQQPRWQPSGSHNVTAHCTLLQQLSQVSVLGVHLACPHSGCGVWQGHAYHVLAGPVQRVMHCMYQGHSMAISLV